MALNLQLVRARYGVVAVWLFRGDLRSYRITTRETIKIELISRHSWGYTIANVHFACVFFVLFFPFPFLDVHRRIGRSGDVLSLPSGLQFVQSRFEPFA